METLFDQSAQHPRVRVWTDGSCLINPGGPGGWAALIVYQDGRRVELTGGDPSTTNNRMELLGAITALEQLDRGLVTVVSDSKYVVDGSSTWMFKWARRGWKLNGSESVKNVDLWLRMYEAVGRHARVEWQWVRGHGDDVNNNRVDHLAEVEARKFPFDENLVRARAELIARTRETKRLLREQENVAPDHDELVPEFWRTGRNTS